MTHLHSAQHSHMVHQRPRVLTPYAHVVNAPLFPLDIRSSALTPIHRNERSEDSPLVVDGEVIASIDTIPSDPRYDTDAPTAWAIELKRNLLWRVIDDPYWILITLIVALGVAITATVAYGAIQIILTVGAWLDANTTSIGAAIALSALVMICGGAKAAKCAGIHCGGCRR
jgi:hypothetical protein